MNGSKKKKDKAILDFPLSAYKVDKNNTVIFQESYYFSNSKIYIAKHNRFADFPLHRHNFVEMNYILSGESTQIVNGDAVSLKKGDILFMGSGCTHSIASLQEDDLLINFAFSFKNFNLYWLEELEPSQSYFLNFLFHNSDEATNQYVIFNGNSNPDLLNILSIILNKYFTNLYFANSILYSYFDILLMELLSNTEAEIKGAANLGDNAIFNLILDISKNFRTVTLEEMAQKYNYHKNYLSKLIKRMTGHTFSEIVAEKRMERAAFLLAHTPLSIQDIIDDINLQNRGHFYDQFTKFYQTTPANYRKKQKKLKK